MNKLLIGGAAAALVVAFAPSVAQPAPPPPGVAQGTAPVAPPQRAREMHVMMMGDKVMTRAEVDQHIRKLFGRFDANHDGFITREEIASVGQHMMAMHGDMRQRFAEHGMMMGDRGAVFDRLDANHDGSISRQEFMASQPRMREQRIMIMRRGDGPAAAGQPAMPGMGGMHEMHMRGMGMGRFGGHLFEMADANHDGRVSLQETEAAALSHFDRADLNHDGRLTPEERSQAHQVMREHRRS